VLRARLATSAVAVPSLLALIFLAPPGWLTVVVSVLAAAAMVEYAGLAFPADVADRGLAIALGAVVIAAAVNGPGPAMTAALGFAIACGFAKIVLFGSDLTRGLSDLGLMMVGIVYVGVLMPHFIWLHRTADGPAWVTFVIAAGMLGDSGGYFVGHAIGRHKLVPRISPGKTVEGAFGVLAGSALAGLGAKVLLLPAHGWRELLSLALGMGVIGQIGDLSESVMKRAFGAKESGWIFPGHGGALDRIDSLLFPVTLVYYYHSSVG
jgi:phosphatidate cytidylyltransferase